MSRKEDVQKLITSHHRRLQKLKERKATLGINADPGIDIEIEDIEAELELLQAELAEILAQEEWAGAPAVYIANFAALPAVEDLPDGAIPVDWSARFAAKPRQVPPAEEWQELLWPELAALPDRVRRTGLIRLHGSCALSTAFAFGQVFMEVGRYRLAVEQYSPAGSQVWRSDAPTPPGKTAPVFSSYIAPGNPNNGAGLVIVYAVPRTSLSNTVQEVGVYWGEGPQLGQVLGQGYRPQNCAGVLVLEAAMVSQGHHLQGWEATALASSSRRFLMEFVRQVNPTRLHIFLAVPSGLAAFLGHHWNAVGKEILCYERLEDCRYAPAFLLK